MPGPASKSVVEPVRLALSFPPKELSPNARVHWRKKATVVAQYREECGWCAKGAKAGMASYLLEERRRDWNDWPLTPPVEATVTFVVPDRRKRDMDNLLAMLKPAWDGLVDAGVLAGDDSERFKVVDATVEVAGCPCGEFRYTDPCVIVSLSGAGTT